MDLVISDQPIRQDKAGRFCLNDLHRAAGDEPRHAPALWERQAGDLIAELQKDTDSYVLAKTRGRNGGTFVCKELVYAYAMWISPAFSIRVIRTFDAVMTGAVNRQRLRHEAASSFKVMTAMLQMTRLDAGKETVGYHYSNEARLINSMLSGEFRGMDRDAMSESDLALLAYLEERNAILIGRDVPYEQRKHVLKQYAMDWRLQHAPRLANDAAQEV